MLECSQAVRVMVDGVESEVRIEGRNVVFMEGCSQKMLRVNGSCYTDSSASRVRLQAQKAYAAER